MAIRRLLIMGLVHCVSIRAARGDVLLDNLCLSDSGGYITGLGNHCGGEDAHGEAYDLQVASYFILDSATFITRVTVDSLTLEGTPTAKLCVAFYSDDDHDLTPDNFALHSEEITTELLHETFNDPIFEIYGVRTTGSLRSSPYFPAGVWFTSLQPASSDWGWLPIGYAGEGCELTTSFISLRDGGDYNLCCDGAPGYGYREWNCSCWKPLAVSIRIEGIPAGDCAGGERVRAKCRVRDGLQQGRIVVSVRRGQPNGAVTALLDPPDPRSMSIALDGSGRGKGKLRGVPLGEHRVFVCDSILDVTCAP